MRNFIVVLLFLWALPVFAENSPQPTESKELPNQIEKPPIGTLLKNDIAGIIFADLEGKKALSYFIPSKDLDAFSKNCTEITAECGEDLLILVRPDLEFIMEDSIVKDPGRAEKVNAVFNYIFASKNKELNKLLNKYESKRVISKQDDIIRTVIRSTKQFEVDVNEVERDTVFAQDIKSILSVIAAGSIPSAKEAMTPQLIPLIHYKDYLLETKRANTSFAVQVKEEAKNPPIGQGSAAALATTTAATTATTAPAQTKIASSANGNAFTKNIVTGPSEHLYISADTTLTKVSQIKYDQTTKTITEREAPSSFYFSLNYALADVLSEHGNPLVLKALFRASDKPQSSLGVGIGLRFKPGNFYNNWLDFLANEWITPFGAVLWTKEDQVVNGNVEKETHYGKPSWVVGLSFNLDKAVSWLKPKDKTPANTDSSAAK